MASARMIALLGLLAVAGYQHREKLGELLGRVTGQEGGGHPPDRLDGRGRDDAEGGDGLGGLLGGLGGLLSGSNPGGGIAGGLRDLIDSFTGGGRGEVARSWVERGPNRPVDRADLEAVLGDETIEALERQTGLGRAELLARLDAVLPDAVDRLTPDGRLPDEQETGRWRG